MGDSKRPPKEGDYISYFPMPTVCALVLLSSCLSVCLCVLCCANSERKNVFSSSLCWKNIECLAHSLAGVTMDRAAAAAAQVLHKQNLLMYVRSPCARTHVEKIKKNRQKSNFLRTQNVFIFSLLFQFYHLHISMAKNTHSRCRRRS